jgi:uncharacterized iron-regulated protein
LAYAVVLLTLLAACATRMQPQPGEIWDVAQQRVLTREQALDAMAAADHVLLGEKHDNPLHHSLQAEIVAALVARGRKPALVLEMLDTDHAPALERHLASRPREAEGFAAAVGWRWPDWPLYQPIVATALAADLPMRAGNLGRADTREVMRQGYQAVPLLRPLLDRPFPPQAEDALLAQLEASHCGQVPRERLRPMLQVQRTRDAALAAAMNSAPQSVLIAGAEHGRTDRGVPWVLAALAPDKRVVSLAFVELRDGKPSAELPFDLVWFTPEFQRPDPCANFPTRRSGS